MAIGTLVAGFMGLMGTNVSAKTIRNKFIPGKFILRVELFLYVCLEMDKREQKKFTQETVDTLKEGGVTIGWFLNAVGISRTHWHFIRNAERPLTIEKKEKIISVLKAKLLYETE